MSLGEKSGYGTKFLPLATFCSPHSIRLQMTSATILPSHFLSSAWISSTSTSPLSSNYRSLRLRSLQINLTPTCTSAAVAMMSSLIPASRARMYFCKLAFDILSGIKSTPNHSSTEGGQISAARMRSASAHRSISFHQAMAVQEVSLAVPPPPSTLDVMMDKVTIVARVEENSQVVKDVCRG